MLVVGIAAAVILGIGMAAHRAMRLEIRPSSLGVLPGLGLAVAAVVSRWALAVQVPELLQALVLLAIAGVGCLLAAVSLTRRDISPSMNRYAAAMLVTACAVVLLVLGSGPALRYGVPDFSDDGAYHVEAIEALRHGEQIDAFTWYPNGFHAPVAAVLALAHGVDSATGAVQWASAITLLAPLAVFGLAAAIWREPLIGGAAALLTALTSAFPYDVHLYCVWPMADALLMSIAFWTRSN